MEKVVLEKLQYKYEQTGKILHKLEVSIKDFTEIDELAKDAPSYLKTMQSIHTKIKPSNNKSL